LPTTQATPSATAPLQASEGALIAPLIHPELGSFAFSTVAERYAEDVPQGRWPTFLGLPKATNCPAFLAYSRRSDTVLAGGGKASQDAYGFAAARCTMLEWLMGATGSKRSFVHDFALTPEAAKALPEAFASQWSSAQASRLVPRQGDRFQWIAHYPKLTVKAETGARVLVVEDRDSQVRVTYWALADINGDGLEDIVFYVVNMAREHAGALHRLVAITRESPSKPFRVVRQYPE